MKNQDDEFILVASVGKPVGLKGWAKVNSFTRPPENLFNFKNFFLEVDGDKENINIDKFSKSGKNYILKVESLDSIEEIERLKNKEIFIKSEDLPKLKENEFYWKDLIGMEVRQIDGTVIGVVVEIIETGSDDVLVVEKNNKKELIPFNFGEIIKEVSDNSIIVDWYI
mgnify:FL=1